MTNVNENQYLDLLYHVKHHGKDRPDRTATGVRGIFGAQQVFDLRKDFPILTTKKMDLKSVSSELIWFLEGSGDERRLAEIRYGKERSLLSDKRTIWTDNAQAPYWRHRAAHEGDLGRVYGVQWRAWRRSDGTTVDQVAKLIEGLTNDPHGRRHILSAWNPGEIDDMALPPCHVMAQFYVQDGELSCMLTQRSADYALGSPYNIVSYSLLTHMVAQVCGLRVGDFVYSMGDVHIYHNHFEGVEEQLLRQPLAAPVLVIDPDVKTIEGFSIDSFRLEGYNPLPAIKMPMAI